MANGKVGDHPFTDVVVHGLEIYSRRAAELIRAIDALADEATRARLADLLLREYNDVRNPDVPRLEKYLTTLHEQLQRDAHDSGWEIQEVRSLRQDEEDDSVAASVDAEPPVLRPNRVLHDVLIVIAGNVLCLALIVVGTFVVMRTSSEGRLMRELAAAANDPAARAAVINGFEDPWGAVTWGNRLLTLVCGVAAAVVGATVGTLVWHRAFWIPILSVLPLAASPLLTLSSYPAAWFRAAAWGAIAWAAATLAGRWRRGRQGR